MGDRPVLPTIIRGYFCHYEQRQSYNETFDLSLCAHDTIAVAIPFIYAVVVCLPYILYLLHEPTLSHRRFEKLRAASVLKMLMAFVFMILYMTEAIYVLDIVSRKQIYHSIIRNLAMVSTSVLVSLITFTERKKGVLTSKCLFLFWSLVTFILTLRLISGIMQKWFYYDQDKVYFIYTCLQLITAAVQFILYGFVGAGDVPAECPKSDVLLADIQTEDKATIDYPASPELQASVTSQLTFWWMTGLIVQGWRKPLRPSCIFALPRNEWSQGLFERFKTSWDTCVKVARKLVATPHNKNITVVEIDPETGQEKKSKPIPHHSPTLKNPSLTLVKALFKAFGLKFAFAGFLKLIQDTLLLLGPVFMMLITKYMKDNSTRPVWHGYMAVFGLLVNCLLQTTFLQQYFFTVSVVGMRVRAALTAAIFNKCLKMSNSARQKTTSGQTVNLMAVDASHFLDTAMFIHVLWSAPLQISIAIILLWINLGPATLAGLIFMILMVVFSGFVARFAKKYQFAKMKKKDERIRLVNEMLMGMKSIKLYAWEKSFQAKIAKARKEEMSFLKKAVMLQCFSATIWNVAPHAVTLLTFASYIYSDPKANLEPVKAFVSIVLFNIMRFPLIVLPSVISNVVQSTVSLKRISNFLMLEEIDESAISHHPDGDSVISFNNASFSWSDSPDSKSSPFSLRDISLEIKRGQLVAVVGQVGAGKTSLISAMLGDMVKLDGSIAIAGSCAYVAQTPWIQNATLKDNVLFSSPEDCHFYDDVISACALKPDLEILAAGDNTEIGEKGINLSGGQKQRIALARALYAKSEVYLLDDPLSAVDSYTARHLFDQVIGPDGILAKSSHGPKTRIWATHRLNFLPNCDHVVLMAEGKVLMQGTFKQLCSDSPSFCELIRSYMQSQEVDNEEALELENALTSEIGTSATASIGVSRQSSVSSGVAVDRDGTLPRKRCVKSPALKQAEIEEAIEQAKKKKSHRITESEEVKEGAIRVSIFASYAKALGAIFVFTVVFFYALSNAFSVGAQNYLSIWTDEVVVNATAALPHKTKNLAVMAILYAIMSICVMIATVTMALSSLRAAVNLHDGLMSSITRTALSFFEATPIGRITNRFSKDMDVIDATLRETIMGFLACFLHVAATFIIISVKLPIFLAVGIPLLGIYIFIQRVFVASMRQLKRIESVARSPLLSQFSETVTGVSTIRAFGRGNQFSRDFFKAVDEYQMATYVSQMGNRWLSVRMELIGSVVIFSTGLFGIVQRDSLDPGALGLALAYAMSVSQTLNWMVRQSSEIETNIVSVERVDEYLDTAKEGDWTIPSIDMSPEMAHWPRQGEIVFENVVLRYREGLEPALRSLSFTVKPKEKVGVVGRTGAGKSSLSVALLRLVEISSGRILIDGIDLSKIGIHTLRRGVTPIPQESTLFSGTLRFNLDPFDEKADEDILHCLELVNMRPFVDSEPKGLDMEIAENGDNLSAGQRQLVCMARALLRRPIAKPNDHLHHRGAHILLMDEATAAVDVSTDRLVTEMVHREFADSTVLTIAHRLDTVINYDKILVLANGQLVEYDTPSNLLSDQQSEFYNMAKAAGLVK